ncbi:hypothetical protein D770_23995 [Flammeovirgaceae bacterium 311]|nr:hypothetical protein D770_23995 [Flammeovirgaceae bacterium 311]
MNRRIALKSLAVVVAGVVFFPGCDQSTTSSAEVVQSFLSPTQDVLLASMVQTLIPATDTPGAKDLDVHLYMKRMVADCHEPEVQKIFFNGLDKVEELAKDKFGKGYPALNFSQQSAILTMLESSREVSVKEFYTLLKGLTIQGYITSEWVMTNHAGYQMVPGHYYGCVPVKQTL